MASVYKILDLYCGAGGAGEGYRRAGFDVTGVDIVCQLRNPHRFINGDALEYLREHGGDFDAVHASPPCQCHSFMTKGRWKDRLSKHVNHIPLVREILLSLGLPYVIENVAGARSELINPVMLCGSMFALQTAAGAQLRRHRLFETSFPINAVPACHHAAGNAIGVYGGGQHPMRQTIAVYGHGGGSSTRDGVKEYGAEDRRDAMGIHWMSGKELSQAIPPAYTEFIGRALKAVLNNGQGGGIQ